MAEESTYVTAASAIHSAVYCSQYYVSVRPPVLSSYFVTNMSYKHRSCNRLVDVQGIPCNSWSPTSTSFLLSYSFPSFSFPSLSFLLSCVCVCVCVTFHTSRPIVYAPVVAPLRIPATTLGAPPILIAVHNYCSILCLFIRLRFTINRTFVVFILALLFTVWIFKLAHK